MILLLTLLFTAIGLSTESNLGPPPLQ